MALKPSINAGNSTLRVTKEASYGVLSGSDVWTEREPNSYGDFGGKNTLVTRAPINAVRRRVKGGVVDREGAAAYNEDVTQDNMRLFLDGLLFAAWRDKGVEIVTAVDLDAGNPDEYEVASSTGFLVGGIIKGTNFTAAGNNTVNVVTAVTGATVEVVTGTLTTEVSPPATAQIAVVGQQFAAGDIDVVTTGAFTTYFSTAFDFTTLGLIPGEFIFVGGDAAGLKFATAANNGFKRVRSVAAHSLIVDKSALAMVAEDNSATSNATIQFYFGSVIKDESADLKVQYSYQFERSLDAPIVGSPSDIQAEYEVGAILNSGTINIPVANKITMDLDFLPTHAEYTTAAAGRKAGTRPALVRQQFFNTSSHFSELKLSVNDAASETPDAFFAYLTEIKITIDNQGELQKAVGVLGGFDVALDDQLVRAESTGYFRQVEVLQAIANNADINMHGIIVARNAGWAFDLPLGGAGGDPLDVNKGAKIMQPLTVEFGDSSDVATGFGHQILFTWFAYLPNLATPVVA